MIPLILMIPTVFAEDEMYVMSVESSDARYSNNLVYNTITTEIYSSILYPAVITIYVEDADMTPIGVMIFKLSLIHI